MPVQRGLLEAAGQVPQLDEPLLPSGGQGVAVRSVRKAADPVGMSTQLALALSPVAVPQLDAAILAGGDKGTTGGREGDGVYRPLMSRNKKGLIWEGCAACGTSLRLPDLAFRREKSNGQ